MIHGIWKTVERPHQLAFRWAALDLLVLCVVGVLLCWRPTAAHAQATFTPLGVFGGTQSFGHDVSADGSVVVGTISGRPGNTNGIFRWTREGSVIHTATVPGPLMAISPDGSTVVGSRFLPQTGLTEAFRWVPDEGLFEGLGDFPGGAFKSEANDVSADGSVIVGSGQDAEQQRAFRWTRESGMVPIPEMREAHGVTPDGAVVVGFGSGLAVRWTAETGPVTLGRLPGAASSGAFAVSADGAVVVGSNSFPAGQGQQNPEASRWTEQEGIINLQSAPWSLSGARDVSADGSAIVGGGLIGDTPGAFYWTAATGMVDLQEFLVSLGVTNLDGWELGGGRGISADGLTIVGTGVHNGFPEAWVATIPEPSSIVLAALAALVLFAIRIRHRSAAGAVKRKCPARASAAGRSPTVWIANQTLTRTGAFR